MISKNPYDVSTSENSVVVRRLTKKSTFMLAISLSLYGVAALMYSFSETWTFHTPYSTEVIWELPLLDGMGIFLNAPQSTTLLLACVALGTMFLLFALVANGKSRPKAS